MDAQWSDDFHHALFAVLSNAPGQGYYADFGELAQLAKALEHNFVYDGLFSKYRDCIQGRPTGDLSQDRFVGFIQNHDQVGNRAIGDRLCEIVGFERAKIAAAVVLMSPFVPLLFQGEEWAASSPFLYFADHDDPEIAHAVSKGRKSEFQAFGWEPESIPDPEAKETFESSKLNWDELSYGTHEAMHAWYRELMRLRRASPSLHDSRPGNTHVAFDEQAKWFTIARGEIVIACNLGSNPQTIVVPHGKQIRLTSRAGLAITERSMTLLPDSLAIIG